MRNRGKTPRELLGEFEERWRPQAERVSLIAEVEFDKQELNTALFCIGTVWKEAHPKTRARRRLRASYPATFAVAVAGTASYRYEGHNAWGPVLEGARLPHDGNLAGVWGRCFLTCLERLGLPTFPELDDEGAHRYVARMLLHGGLPVDHLDEWWEVVTAAMRRLDTRDPSVLHAWLVNRAEAQRLYRATVAVDRFLRLGGEFAVDFLDRSLDLLQQIRAGDGLEDIRVGLPRRYVRRGLELRARRMLPGDIGGGSRSGRWPARAEISFDPYGTGVFLQLPAIREATGSVTWTVAVDGKAQSVRVHPARPGLPTEAAEIPLPPTTVDVEISRYERTTTSLTVVDPGDPLLLFDRGGRQIDRTSRLPRDLVWAVRPDSRALTARGARRVETHEVVPRWEGWVADLWDLTEAHEIRLEQGRRHGVETDRSAMLRGLTLVPGVTTEDGHPVSSTWPQVVLPGSQGGSSWQLTVIDAEHGRLREVERDVGAEDSTVHLAELVGEHVGRVLEIRARGPLGRSLRDEIVVVPGLELGATPSFRTFTKEGLSPTRVELVGLAVPPFFLEPDERSRRVELEQGVALVVEPPAVAIQHLQGGVASSWHYAPLRLELESLLEGAGDLLVRLPVGADASAVRLLVCDATGERGQVVPPTGRARGDGSLRWNLARVTDTLRRLGAGALVVRSPDWTGRVASIQPAALAEQVDVSSDRGVVQLREVAASGVQAAFYSRLAPKFPPRVVEVPPGDPTVPIPTGLLSLGPLRMVLRVEDPWAPEPWPEWPEFPTLDRNVHDLDDLGWDRMSLWAADPLAPYLAGAEELPEDLGPRFGDVLRLFTLAHDLDPARSPWVIRRELGARLAERPSHVLGAALDVGLEGAALAQALADTGLVAAEVGPDLSVDEVERLWTRWPGAGILAATPHLSQETREQHAIRELLVTRCGSGAEDLLAGKPIDALWQPQFDNPDLIDWGDERLRLLEAAANIVPRTLLDVDSRARDGFLALRRLKSGDTLPKLIGGAESAITYALQCTVTGIDLPVLEEAIRRRAVGRNWQLLPAMSLALATIARLAARRSDPSRIFTGSRRRALERFAQAVPSLVGADLVMAELAIQGVLR